MRIGKLKVEPCARAELDGLVRSARARLADAKRPELSDFSRFDLAYNAAHSFALAALRHVGYRADSRYIVFQCLEHTLKMPPEQWRVLAQAHGKRNLAEYTGDFDVEAPLLAALLRAGDELARRVELAVGP